MTASLHPALRSAAAAADERSTSQVEDVVASLDAFAEHLQDAIDMLGSRASGLSMASAARHVAEVLAPLARLTRRGEDGRDPMPADVRSARSHLRDADMCLDELSRNALGLVPMPAGEQARLDLRLCRWVDAARLLATWVEEVLQA